MTALPGDSRRRPGLLALAAAGLVGLLLLATAVPPALPGPVAASLGRAARHLEESLPWLEPVAVRLVPTADR